MLQSVIHPKTGWFVSEAESSSEEVLIVYMGQKHPVFSIYLNYGSSAKEFSFKENLINFMEEWVWWNQTGTSEPLLQMVCLE